MPIKPELLDILCDPVTKGALATLATDKLAQLNAAIARGAVKDASGNVVTEALEEALVTVDHETVYRVDGDVPVLLAEAAIPTTGILT